MDTLTGIALLILATTLLVDWVRADTFTGLPRRLRRTTEGPRTEVRSPSVMQDVSCRR